ncbi:MAG: hypothetical protein EXQ98_05770 [Alphaproteobacteria bacterium]|nr:hypothetical protein [Alphaproteobacteria bacterium]
MKAVRILLIGAIAATLLAASAYAQVSDPPKADECEAYYRFELQVIEEQRYYLTQAAIKAVEAELAPKDDKTQHVEQARVETDKRFSVDYDAAKRSRERCLKRAK